MIYGQLSFDKIAASARIHWVLSICAGSGVRCSEDTKGKGEQESIIHKFLWQAKRCRI